MTPEQFLEWLNEEIEQLDRDSFTNRSTLFQQSIVSSKAMLIKVKEKFITLTPPPTTLNNG